MIFYPGAKVDTTSYAPLLKQIASTYQVDCFLVDMPCHFAIYGMNKANQLMEKYAYDKWYLGGAMIGSYAKKHCNQIDGLVLLGTYVSADLSQASFPVEVIVGSEDQIINRNKLEQGALKALSQYTVSIIDGGNHAYFGSYGKQSGDGQALLIPKQQLQQTIDLLGSIIQ